jgi:hypothetical protein
MFDDQGFFFFFFGTIVRVCLIFSTQNSALLHYDSECNLIPLSSQGLFYVHWQILYRPLGFRTTRQTDDSKLKAEVSHGEERKIIAPGC